MIVLNQSVVSATFAMLRKLEIEQSSPAHWGHYQFFNVTRTLIAARALAEPQIAAEADAHPKQKLAASHQLAHSIGCVARLAGGRHLMKSPVDIAHGIDRRGD